MYVSTFCALEWCDMYLSYNDWVNFWYTESISAVLPQPKLIMHMMLKLVTL